MSPTADLVARRAPRWTAAPENPFCDGAAQALLVPDPEPALPPRAGTPA